MASYQQYMSCTDYHDYLRMARYSVRFSHIFKKWYKMFFCSMVDLALVNAYILWKLITKNNAYTDHASFI